MPSPPPGWTVVIPVKRPQIAKTRLADVAGAHRAALARALAADTVAAACGCAAVQAVVVVTDDDEAAGEAAALGALAVPDAPGAGLNAALRHGASVAGAGAAVAALSADLPALRPAELALALHEAGRHGEAFVSDVAGTGTTLYAAAGGRPFNPRFGGRSRAAHRAAGVVEIGLPGLTTVRRDVDTAVDLWDALRLGVGPRTAAVAGLLHQ